MSEELKPVRCGCGGKAEVLKFNNDSWLVMCNKCRTSSENYTSRDKAIQAWNRAMGELTAKAKVNFKDENFFFGWCECGQYQSSQFPYFPACGCRLEWE